MLRLDTDPRIARTDTIDIADEGRGDLVWRKCLQDVDARAGEESIIDGEARILGGRADERDHAFFHEWQKNVLLSFVPAMDLVEEDDGLTSCGVIITCGSEDSREVFFFADDTREMMKLRVEELRNKKSDRRLACTGGSPEDHGRDTTRLDEFSDRTVRTEEVRLSGELIKRARTQHSSQRLDRRGEWEGLGGHKFYADERNNHGV